MANYKALESGFERYDAESATANGIMDLINTYADERDFRTIKVEDRRAWRDAMGKAVLTGQTKLQGLMEYKAAGCQSPAAQIDA